MKLRSGFVSNSSSSSYIIRIPKGRVLPLEEYKNWFGIRGDDPIKLQKIVICFWLAIYAYQSDKEDGYCSFNQEDILIDPKEVLEYYSQWRDENKILSQMLYEIQHPEEFPETEIIGFEANDNVGNLINYDLTEVLSNAGTVSFEGDNVYAINEH